MKVRRYQTVTFHSRAAGLWESADGRFVIVRPATVAGNKRANYWLVNTHDDSPTRDSDRHLLASCGLIPPGFSSTLDQLVRFPTRRAALEALELALNEA
jgi:hypothetical protein